MTVPKRAILALLLCCTACPAEVVQPPAAATESCGRRHGSHDVDPTSGTWRMLSAPHSAGVQVDAVLDNCEAIVSLGHDYGPGGKVYQPGPAELLWSENGRDWQRRDMSTQAFFRSVAWGEGAWVAVGEHMGGGVITVSKRADASDWHQVFTHSMYFRSVAYGAGTFVAVTQAGVAVSSDGERWRWATLPDVSALYFEVAFGAGRFVVAGVGATLNSIDGEHWELSDCGERACPAIQPPSGPASTTIALQEMRFAAGAFYAFGASGHLRSSDGLAFWPYAGEQTPDAKVGDTLLSLAPVHSERGTSLAESTDGGGSWRGLPLAAATASADCDEQLCISTPRAVLVFEPSQ